MGDSLKVSVIIAAYNAATTIAKTLESLCAQTSQDWEAIVVDDESRDETASVASRFADYDDRIRLASRSERGGESAARNTGIIAARYEWLLFLDADDWISPLHLERMTEALISDSSLDAVHCGWTRIAPNGTLFDQMHASSQSSEMFATLARYCALAIHACVVRRSTVEAVGGFDVTLRTCPDWDLWQRVARSGARFGAIPDSLAFYRMRAGSASTDGFQLLADGLRVITRGHSPDGRVPHPYPPYADGIPADQLPNARLLFACWAAGLVIGIGEDAMPLLDAVHEDHDPAIDPKQVARQIFEAALLPTCCTPSDWLDIWPGLERNINEFLQALEIQAMAPGLAIRSRRVLEHLILEPTITRLPVTIGTKHAVRVEITEPILDVVPPAFSDRLLICVEVEGERVGAIELPVCDGIVPAYVLADAIAAEFAWQILGRYFEQTVYKTLEMKPGENGPAIWRGDLCLAVGFDQNEGPFWPQVHSEIGWTVFLQEICSRPDWPTSFFYDSQAVEEACERLDTVDHFCIVEISQPIPDIRVSGRELKLIPTVGGAPLGVLAIPIAHGIASAHRLRTAIVAETGFELARAAVREGLLGKPLLAPPASIRERLAARHNDDNSTPEAFENIRSGTCSAAALHSIVPDGESTIVFGRRTERLIGTSASRRAVLPAASAPELIDASTIAGEVVIHSPQSADEIRHVVYAPDLIAFRSRNSEATFTVSCRRNPPPSATFETHWLPILMYHRVARTGSTALSRYRVSPEAFEEQLGFLRHGGYYSIGMEDWRIAMKNQQPLPGRAVMLTFDDGYLDFITYAWPLLQRYGFSATVFLVADEIGGTNRWDKVLGEEVPLLGWEHIRHLRDEGIEFGSHSAKHRPLDTLSPAEVVREGAHSRAILERGLGLPVRSFAYPHGAEDRAIQHLIGACGYIFGLSCQMGLSGFHDPMLALPRVEITGSDILQRFIAKLGVGQESSSYDAIAMST